MTMTKTESAIGMIGLGVMGRNLALNICQAVNAGVPEPGLMVSPGYLDALRGARRPASLIQARRGHFGARSYERINAKGSFHTEWEKA
jgi:6-phosphogluconate dehydrogenase